MYLYSLLLLFFACCIVASHQAAVAKISPRIDGRIINGKQAAPNQFPWQVILKRDEYDDLLCGGSIIAPQWVLTAAHCAYQMDSLFLIFGTNQLDDSNAVNMTSTQLYVNPNYNSEYLNNDIALVQLPQPLTYSKSIQPIALVAEVQQGNNFVGTVATISGFGLVDDEYLDYSETLLYAQVQIIDNSKCLPIFGKNVVLSSTMCATGLSGSNMSTCSGDSGGPLVIQDPSSGTFSQIGINSFVAQDRCTEGFPSGYVRLTSYLDYIYQTTGIQAN